MVLYTLNDENFLGHADVSDIRKGYETGLIDGITTNPTLIMRSGRNPEDVYQELIDMGIPDISMEVVGDANEMLQEGLRLSDKFNGAATIKVPCTPDGLLVCKELHKAKIRTNVTLIFSVAQAILAAKLAQLMCLLSLDDAMTTPSAVLNWFVLSLAHFVLVDPLQRSLQRL